MRAALRAWWHGIGLRDAVVFTLPFVALVVFTYAVAVARAARARDFDDWWSRPKGVHQFAGYQLRGWMNALDAQSIAHKPGTHAATLMFGQY